MAMTFEEMCATCPVYDFFAINNIPEDRYQDLLDILSEIKVGREPPANLAVDCKGEISIRFFHNGDFAGWLDGNSYKTIANQDIRGWVRGGNYEFSELEPFCDFQATLDVMSVL